MRSYLTIQSIWVLVMRIADSSVLSDGIVVEIEILRVSFLDGLVRKSSNVLDENITHRKGRCDHRISTFVEVDELRIKSCLKIADSVVCPCVLVITNQLSIWILR